MCCRNNAFHLHFVQILFFHYTVNLSLPGIEMRSEEHLWSLDMQTSDVVKKDLLETTGRCSFGSFHLNLSLKHGIFQEHYVCQDFCLIHFNHSYSLLSLHPVQPEAAEEKAPNKQEEPWGFGNGYRTCRL